MATFNFGNIGPSGRGGGSTTVKGMSWSASTAREDAVRGQYRFIDSTRQKGTQPVRKYNPAKAWTRTFHEATANKAALRATFADVFVDGFTTANGYEFPVRVVASEADFAQLYPEIVKAALSQGIQLPSINDLLDYNGLKYRVFSARSLYGNEYVAALDNYNRTPVDKRPKQTPQFTQAQVADIDRDYANKGRAYLSQQVYLRDKFQREKIDAEKTREGKNQAKKIHAYNLDQLDMIANGIKETFEERVHFVKTQGGDSKEKGIAASVRKIIDAPQDYVLDITNVWSKGQMDVSQARKQPVLKKAKRGGRSVTVDAIHGNLVFFLNVNGVDIRLLIRTPDGRHDDRNGDRVKAVAEELLRKGFTLNQPVALRDIDEFRARFDSNQRQQQQQGGQQYQGFAQGNQQGGQGQQYQGNQQQQYQGGQQQYQGNQQQGGQGQQVGGRNFAFSPQQ